MPCEPPSPPARISPRIVCPPLAFLICVRYLLQTPHELNVVYLPVSAFNQPLALDTSSVTGMGLMFYVRSAHALRTTQPPARTSFRIVCPPLGSRQGASAFNQPLSFDTSSVTDMRYMFLVSSARGLPPIWPHPCISGIPDLCEMFITDALRTVCHMPSCLGVQPAAGSRHVQRRRYE